MAFKSESFQIEKAFSARMLPQSLRDSSLPEGAGSIVPPFGREGDREAVEGDRR